MKRQFVKLTAAGLLLSALALGMANCKKDAHMPPSIVYNASQGYVYKDTTLAQGTTYNIGVTVVKEEDDLKTYNVAVAYDGGGPTNKHTETISGDEKSGFTRTQSLTTRTQAGTEKVTVTVTDADGNTANSTPITITVK